MTVPTSVTAEELVRALKKRRATLPAEIGSFLVLEACEALQARGCYRLLPSNVEISDEGTVRLGEVERVSEQEAAYSLHGLLAAMLVAAGPAPHPALMRLLEHGPSDGRWLLASVRDDLEASLVPLNRNASRRVLARFVREIGWAERPSAKRPTFQDLDSELSSFLDGGETQPDPSPGPAPARRQPAPDDVTRRDSVEDVDDSGDQLRFFESVRPVAREPTGKTVLDASPSYAERMASQLAKPNEEPRRAPPLSYRPRGPRELEEEPRRAGGSSSALWVGGLMLLLSGAALGGVYYLRPELFARLTTPDAPPAKQAPEVIVKRPTGGDLTVNVSTERAQILRFVGRGPITVPHVPLGVAHEFVATAEGMAPARLLVPRDAEWESTPDGKRYEAAMQLSPAQGQGTTELGETLLPRDVGTPTSTLGSLRIVTTPKGAKVYQVIGFAPQAVVEQLPVDATQELLIFRKGHAPEVRVVAPSDYVEEGGRRRATLDVTLAPLPKSR